MTTTETAHAGTPAGTARPDDITVAFDVALNDADLDGLMRLFDPDATMRMADGTTVAEGRDAVRAELARLLDGKPRLHNTVRRVLASDDLALVIIDWEIHHTVADGERIDRGTGTNVVQRGADGRWLLRIANPLGVQ